MFSTSAKNRVKKTRFSHCLRNNIIRDFLYKGVVACSSPEIQEQSLELIGLYGKVLYFAGLPPNHLAMEMIASGFTERLCDS